MRDLEIQMANKRAEIRRLKNEPSPPVLPGPQERDDTPRGHRRRRRRGDGASEVGEATQHLVPNFFKIRRLEGEINDLNRQRQQLLPEHARVLRQMNEMIDGRGCIVQAMRRKGCLGV